MARSITIEKLRLYEWFGGNEDAWARYNGPTLSHEDWYLIERFVSDIVPIDSGLTSSGYTEAFYRQLSEASIQRVRRKPF
jgi:hypothetical protein